MKVIKEKDKIIFEIPYWTDIYDKQDDKPVGKHKTLAGIIEKDSFGEVKMGFADVIDMSYKGKENQYSDIMIHWHGCGEEDFEKLCKKLKLDLTYFDNSLI